MVLCGYCLKKSSNSSIVENLFKIYFGVFSQIATHHRLFQHGFNQDSQ